jgi:hypothetical protein
MENTPLDELLEDEHQKLLYVFDYMYERAFFMELSEIITGKKLEQPVCSLTKGEPPAQTLTINEVEKNAEHFDLGEDFYGDSEFNEDELDAMDDDYDRESIDSIFDDDRF